MAKGIIVLALLLVLVAGGWYVTREHTEVDVNQQPALSSSQPPNVPAGELLPPNTVVDDEFQRTPKSESSRPDSETGEAVPLRPEFEDLFRNNPYLSAAHTALEQEPRDELWASGSEAKFRVAFAGNHELQGYGQPIVECRSSRCEVKLLAYGATHLSHDEWTSLIAQGLIRDSTGRPVPAPLQSPVGITFGTIETNGASVVVINFQFARETPESTSSP